MESEDKYTRLLKKAQGFTNHHKHTEYQQVVHFKGFTQVSHKQPQYSYNLLIFSILHFL